MHLPPLSVVMRCQCKCNVSGSASSVFVNQMYSTADVWQAYGRLWHSTAACAWSGAILLFRGSGAHYAAPVAVRQRLLPQNKF